MAAEILTARRVAERAGERLGRHIRPGTVLDWAKAGRLPIVGRNKGGVWLFSERAVDVIVLRERQQEK